MVGITMPPRSLRCTTSSLQEGEEEEMAAPGVDINNDVTRSFAGSSLKRGGGDGGMRCAGAATTRALLRPSTLYLSPLSAHRRERRSLPHSAL